MKIKKVNMLKLRLKLIWQIIKENYGNVYIIDSQLNPDPNRKLITKKDFEDLQAICKKNSEEIFELKNKPDTLL